MSGRSGRGEWDAVKLSHRPESCQSALTMVMDVKSSVKSLEGDNEDVEGSFPSEFTAQSLDSIILSSTVMFIRQKSIELPTESTPFNRTKMHCCRRQMEIIYNSIKCNQMLVGDFWPNAPLSNCQNEQKTALIVIVCLHSWTAHELTWRIGE